MTLTHKIMIVYSLEHFACKTACITVIQAISPVKCLQELNYQYFVGKCDGTATKKRFFFRLPLLIGIIFIGTITNDFNSIITRIFQDK